MNLFSNITNLFLAPTDLSPNAQLRTAICKAKPTDCRFILEMRADPNATYDDGKTPLQVALERTDLFIAKILIDNGANATAENERCIESALMESSLSYEGCAVMDQSDLQEEAVRLAIIKKKFMASRLPKQWKNAFMFRRPKLYSPEVLQQDQFVPLSQIAGSKLQVTFNKPLALFFFADECQFSSYYGNVTKRLFASWNENYEGVSKYFTIVRVLVDDRKRLVSTIERIKDFFGTQILHLSFDAHSTPSMIGLGNGQNGLFKKEHEVVMRESASLLDPLGTVAFFGCNCANGDDNFVQVFSRNAGGRVVWGANHPTSGIKLCVAEETMCNRAIIVPFLRNKKAAEYSIKMYRNGQLLGQGTLDNLDLIQKGCKLFLSEQRKSWQLPLVSQQVLVSS